MKTTLKIDVEELKKSMLQRRPMKARFRIPMSEDKAYAYLLAAIMAEVEYRHRVFCSNEDMEKQLQEMAHWLTTPSSHFGILLCGGCGNGKSTMLKAFQQLLNALHIPKPYNEGTYGIRIVDAKYIAYLCKNNYEAYRKLISVDMLGIDDLGTELTNAFTTSRLFSCLNERLLRKKSTIISTNLSLDELQDIYSERIFSRLISNYQVTLILGDDIRVQKSIS